MTRLDCIATGKHYLDHVAPVYRALGREHRGNVLVRDLDYAHEQRIGRARLRMPMRDRPILVTSKGDLGRAIASGRSHIAYMDHGIGGEYRKQPVAEGYARVELYLVAGPQGKRSAKVRSPQARIVQIGSPFVDALPSKDPAEPFTVALSFHHTIRNYAEKRPAFDHYRDVLPDLAKKVNLIGHGHPLAIEQYATYWRSIGVEVVRGFREVCRRADVYIADTSSTIYEFAATGRPVVLLNAPWYRRDHENPGVARFWKGAHVGINVDEPDDLPAAIEKVYPPPDDALDLIFSHRDGKAAQRAAKELLRWAES